MFRFSLPLEYVVPNVQILIKVKHNDELLDEWTEGEVVSVIKRGIFDENVSTRCKIRHEQQDTYTVETLCQSSYEKTWKFTPQYTKIVNELINYATEEYSSSDNEDDDDDLSDTDSISSIEYNQKIIKKRNYSLCNNIFATMLLLLPYVASFMVVYNARYDILYHLKKRYC